MIAVSIYISLHFTLIIQNIFEIRRSERRCIIFHSILLSAFESELKTFAVSKC